MSLKEKNKGSEKFEDVKQRFGFYPDEIIGKEVDGYTVDRYLDHGAIGVVFHATGNEIGDEVACKIIPRAMLRNGWETELKKLALLDGVEGVVQYKRYFPIDLTERKIQCVCILRQFINGENLKTYARSHPKAVTLEFIMDILEQSLRVFHACKVSHIDHGDFHEGNIMIACPDERFIDKNLRIMITDFGIGSSNSKIEQRNDYLQLSRICTDLIRKYIDPSVLDGESRYLRDSLLNDFLGKQLIEENPTVDKYVKNPERLLKNLKAITEDFHHKFKGGAKLQSPFDYLSCEQFGDSFELLQALYSKNFPGYENLLERTNTILTGPRGCGKTTIFRNLSLKAQLLAGKKDFQDHFVGIYYNCKDLYYAFPYKIKELGETAQRTITHYFNLALLTEIISTLTISEEKGKELPSAALTKLQDFLKPWLSSYEEPPVGASVTHHLLSVITEDKEKFRESISKNGIDQHQSYPMPQDFLEKLCSLLQSSIPWLDEVPFFFFLDDYSIPRVTSEVQKTLNCFIFNRNPGFYFKISTESIISINLYDSTGKMLEETREYDIIDLGYHFLFASHEIESDFLREVINSRLKEALDFKWKSKDIREILGDSPYKSYTDLAYRIQDHEHVKYSGWDTVVDLCSGDISYMLRLIRNMFSAAEGKNERNLMTDDSQDTAIREIGTDFLKRVEAVPDTGRRLREVVEAFGAVANHYLKTRSSRNVDIEPPMQAFRIEPLETLDFDEEERQRKLVDVNVKAVTCYNDLIKYGIFIQDSRGKSQKGAVVSRLYLRRLLIPKFVLTPSKRDSIRLQQYEFIMLLTNPKEFVSHMMAKPPRRPELETTQERL